MTLLQEFVKRYPWQSIFLVVMLLLAGVADGIGVSALLPTLEIAFQSQTSAEPNDIARFFQNLFAWFDVTPTLGKLLVVIVTGIAIKNLFVFFADQRIGYIAASVTTKLRMALLAAITSSRWQYFVRQSAGRLANSMATEAWRASNAYVYAVRVLALCVEAVVYTVVSVLVSWQATLICLIASATVLAASQVFVRISQTAGTGQTYWYRSLLGTLTDLLASIKSFKAMGLDHTAESVLATETRRLKHALKREVLGNAALEAAQEPMYMVIIAVGIYIAVAQLSVDMATVSFLALILAKLLRQFGKVQKQYQRMVTCASAYWALQDSINEARREAEVWPGSQTPTLDDAIAIEHVSFAYGDHAVLDDVSLVIPARQLTCLLGASGVGKTTIADLIIGLAEPSSGRIIVDGQPLTSLDLTAWRQKIGYVPQENLLLHDTVLHNVTLGNDNLSEDDVEAALRTARAWTFVQAMPDDLHSVVGERGARLSSGQRQRIMIARALVRQPTLLILDEATSALDPESTAAICAMLDELKQRVTVLAISHQAALTSVSDRTVRLINRKLYDVTEESFAVYGEVP